MSADHRTFVCRCEDIDLAEVQGAIEEGYDDLESLRRFTALGTGPCQGKACLAECIRLIAAHHQVPEDEVGLMTLRPPVVPLPLGHLAMLSDELVDDLIGRTRDGAARAKDDDEETIRTGRPTPESVAKAQRRHAEGSA